MHAISHRRWVRISHWTIAFGFLLLVFTGILILMVHPRLYWGEVGNDLVPAFLELPISGNHQPEGWELAVTFSALSNAPISAERTYPIFNQNGWGRSLHFLAAWILVIAGTVYLLAGLISGHLRRNIVPSASELSPTSLANDARDHLSRSREIGTGPPYGAIQKTAYAGVVLLGLPLMLLTGLTMSPAVTAAAPFLLDLFGGYQSARTIHFFGFATLILFLLTHLAMVFVSGAGRQIKAMVIGR
jgi:thiosulfate reductase cytochrome b subunit